VTGAGENVGGLIGYTEYGAIMECRADVNVQGDDTVGGLIGLISNMNTIEECSSYGDVVAATGYAGGFSGRVAQSCDLTDCYSWGNVAGGSSYVGGFTGRLGEDSDVTNCYSVGYIDSEATEIGGFIAVKDASTTITNSFWDTETSGSEDGEGVGHVTSWMQTQSNYESAEWDFETVWDIV